MSRTARRWSIWVFVIGGGLLQYAYTSTRHPSTILKVWESIYIVLGVVWMVSLLLYARSWVTNRRLAHRT